MNAATSSPCRTVGFRSSAEGVPERNCDVATWPGLPDDQSIREARLDAPGVDETLNNLDTEYYDLEAAIDAVALVSAHLGGQPA